MVLHEHLQQFAGKPVVDWSEDAGLKDAANPIARLSLSYDEYDTNAKWLDLFAAFLEEPDVSQVTGIVVGVWDFESSETSQSIVEALVSARDRLPNLRALFLGDILSEENEMSWIQQSDLSPLFDAYSELEHLGVRGGSGLNLGSPRHEKLQSLRVETGGMDAGIVQGLNRAQLPNLEHLELWLGTSDYGATVAIEDLQPILGGELFPRLRYLGLRNCEMADEVARAVASAPIVERIQTLDLSLGSLSDEGAQALAQSPSIARLEKLDIHYHYCSDAAVEALRSAINGELDATDAQKPDGYDGESYRYVAVGE